MAKLTVSVDTKTNEVMVSVNDKPVENVTEVMVSKYGKNCYFEICKHEGDEDTRTYTRISADQKKGYTLCEAGLYEKKMSLTEAISAAIQKQ